MARTRCISPGPLWEISVTTRSDGEQAIVALLENSLQMPVTSWTDWESGRIRVSVFLDDKKRFSVAKRAALHDGLRRIKSCGLSIGPARIAIEKLPREDWAESWKRHFKPLVIGNALLVKPSWSKRRPRKGQSVVVLDPGLSFGTGQHPTTEFCLRQLVSRRDSTQPQAFLDIGTGSGILAIAAAKLGYERVYAFDRDPQSVRVARANARANRISRKLRIVSSDLTKLRRRAGRKYDVVCANLLANLLIAERDRILARVKPGGALVIAGILSSEFREVAAAYEAASWKLIASRAEEEWRSGTFAHSIRPEW